MEECGVVIGKYETAFKKVEVEKESISSKKLEMDQLTLKDQVFLVIRLSFPIFRLFYLSRTEEQFPAIVGFPFYFLSE